jgi:hypothetical protein
MNTSAGTTRPEPKGLSAFLAHIAADLPHPRDSDGCIGDQSGTVISTV